MKPLRGLTSLTSFVLALLSLLTTAAFGQEQLVAGKVTDQQNRQALAFVNVVVNDGQYGGMSDINGKYSLTSPEPVRTLTFSCLGYETAVVELKADCHRQDVALKPTSFQLGEVTIEAGENPAHRIIDSVMAHRDENHPNSLDSYRYHIYDQMVITVDSSNFGKLLDTVAQTENIAWLDSMMKKNDLMVMETFSEVLYQQPDHYRQNVLGTKMAGSKENQLVYLVSSMQSTSFYDETVSVANSEYLNPISKNSKRRYFFNLESVTPVGQGDSLYLISFHPLRGSSFDGLKGVMTIHSDGWALQNVKAEPEQQGGLYTISIQQLYQKVDGQWFPKQLNTNMVFPALAAKVDGYSLPMAAIGKSYVTDVELHPHFDRKAFSDVEVLVHEDAAYRDDEFWTQYRIDSLTERILNTYHLYDTLPGVSDLFDRALNLTDKMVQSTALPIGPVDWRLDNSFRYSRMRGFYVGLHLVTNDRLSRHIRLQGFGGYWTRLKDFDYGYGLSWLPDRQRQMELGFQYAHQSSAMGEFNGFNEGANFLTQNQFRYTFYENVLVRGTNAEVFFKSRFAQHFKGYVTFGVYDKSYHQQFYVDPSEALASARLVNVELKLRFAYKEKFLSTTKGLQSFGTRYPVVWLSYAHSFQGILGGQYEFDRWKFQVEKDFQTAYHGVFTMLLQAGYASEGCPVVEAFDIYGSYEPFGLYSPGSFATMWENTFFCDRFVALFLSHDFRGTIWSPDSEWFQPHLSLVTNLGWGDMRKGVSSPSMNFSTMEHGFFESGVVVRGLVRTPLVQLGAGVFYRFGAYSYPNAWANLAFKWSTSFTIL